MFVLNFVTKLKDAIIWKAFYLRGNFWIMTLASPRVHFVKLKCQFVDFEHRFLALKMHLFVKFFGILAIQ